MKRCWILGLVLMVGLLPARADDATKRAKVQEFFAVVHISQLTGSIVDNVRKQMDAAMRSTPGMDKLTPEQSRLLNDCEAKVMTLADEAVSWKALEPQMIDLYASTCDEAEIDGLLCLL